MSTELEDRRIAILAEDQYEDLELWYPLLRMKEAGATVVVVGMPDLRTYESKHGYRVKTSAVADQVSADDFDGIIIVDEECEHISIGGIQACIVGVIVVSSTWNSPPCSFNSVF